MESDLLLDELNEGIIILDETTHEPLYCNRVALNSKLLNSDQDLDS